MNENEQIQEMANDLKKAMYWEYPPIPRYAISTLNINQTAENLYSKGYRKVKPGEWRLIGNANGGFCGGVLYYRCTCCGYEITQARIGEANFCEWCGADMRGNENEKQ